MVGEIALSKYKADDIQRHYMMTLCCSRLLVYCFEFRSALQSFSCVFKIAEGNGFPFILFSLKQGWSVAHLSGASTLVDDRDKLEGPLLKWLQRYPKSDKGSDRTRT